LLLSGFPWAEAHGYLKLSRCDNPNSIDVEDTYNFENRIVERETSDGRHIEIVYDGDGNRVSKTADGITVYYLVDANNLTGYAQVMEELVTNHVGALVVDRVYTYGLDLISQYKYESGPGSPYWDVSYYGYDGHGNVRFLTDSDGNITDTYDYDAFGTLTGRQVLDPSIGLVPVDASNESLVTQNHYLYCAEQFNPDLGLYFLRARYMDPERGRFWTMDSFEGVIRVPASLHKYLYANANPVSFVDPIGTRSIAAEYDLTSLMIGISITAGLVAWYASPNIRRASCLALVSIYTYIYEVFYHVPEELAKRNFKNQFPPPPPPAPPEPPNLPNPEDWKYLPLVGKFIKTILEVVSNTYDKIH
jgi:RHS repeat-associated protein